MLKIFADFAARLAARHNARGGIADDIMALCNSGYEADHGRTKMPPVVGAATPVVAE